MNCKGRKFELRRLQTSCRSKWSVFCRCCPGFLEQSAFALPVLFAVSAGVPGVHYLQRQTVLDRFDQLIVMKPGDPQPSLTKPTGRENLFSRVLALGHL